MSGPRRTFTAAQKADVIRRHPLCKLGGTSPNDCVEFVRREGISPMLYHGRKNQL